MVSRKRHPTKGFRVMRGKVGTIIAVNHGMMHEGGWQPTMADRSKGTLILHLQLAQCQGRHQSSTASAAEHLGLLGHLSQAAMVGGHSHPCCLPRGAPYFAGTLRQTVLLLLE